MLVWYSSSLFLLLLTDGLLSDEGSGRNKKAIWKPAAACLITDNRSSGDSDMFSTLWFAHRIGAFCKATRRISLNLSDPLLQHLDDLQIVLLKKL